VIVDHFWSLPSLVYRPTQPPASGAPPHPNTAALQEGLGLAFSYQLITAIAVLPPLLPSRLSVIKLSGEWL
jgi:hypothetical protein